MNIRDIRQLKTAASEQLSSAPNAKNIVLVYGGITVAMAALVTVINFITGTEMSNFGGLSNIGIRSFLSTIQTVLPMIQSVVLLALELGYVNACLRISRGQYASYRSLKMGFDRFLPMLRLSLMQGLIYLFILMLSVYFGVQIFLLTPLGSDAMTIVSNLTAAADPMAAMDEATYLAFSQAIIPLFPVWGIVFLSLFLPIFYQFRLTNYILIDNPNMRTMQILRQSRQYMRRNRLNLLRLDLSMWWYFLLTLLATTACYGDLLLPLLGVQLPWSDTVGYFVFYGVYLVLEFAIFYLFLNRVGVTYAMAYQSLCPEKKEDSAVVLGNIFQM
jgi:uncharacterized membrane protein